MNNEPIIKCGVCGNELEEVRPNKHQCNYCESMILPTYQIKIYLSGPIEVAKQVIREHLLERPLCVTIEPTTFIYVGGEETGYVVGLLNYPRFPVPPNELNVRASILAEILIKKTFQRSALIVRPEDTTWVTLENIEKTI
jgi:hypothetical protein